MTKVITRRPNRIIETINRLAKPPYREVVLIKDFTGKGLKREKTK